METTEATTESRSVNGDRQSSLFRTQDEFLKLSKDAFGDKYSYEKSVYISAQKKIIITCRDHGDFLRTPLDFTYRKRACPGCMKDKRTEKAIKEFINKSRKIHGDKYDYSLITEFVNGDTLVPIICPIHGKFMQKPSRHYSGVVCKNCRALSPKFKEMGIKRRLTNENFIAQAVAMHGDKFDYSKVKYQTMRILVKIKCSKHGNIEVTPAYHLSNSGCYHCGTEALEAAYKKTGPSWIASRWLDDEHVTDREERIPNLTSIADGIDFENKVVYEFYGCFWHGCLKCFKPDKLNTKLNLTAGELNSKTLAREKEILNQGFTLKIIWECTYRKNRLNAGLSIKPPKNENTSQ